MRLINVSVVSNGIAVIIVVVKTFTSLQIIYLVRNGM